MTIKYLWRNGGSQNHLIATLLIFAVEFLDAPEIKPAAWNLMVMCSLQGFEAKFKNGLNLLWGPLSLGAMYGAQPTSLHRGGKPELKQELNIICCQICAWSERWCWVNLGCERWNSTESYLQHFWRGTFGLPTQPSLQQVCLTPPEAKMQFTVSIIQHFSNSQQKPRSAGR